MKNSALIRGTVTSATACLECSAEEPGKAGRGGRWDESGERGGGEEGGGGAGGGDGDGEGSGGGGSGGGGGERGYARTKRTPENGGTDLLK